jgi:hypothetical protein
MLFKFRALCKAREAFNAEMSAFQLAARAYSITRTEGLEEFFTTELIHGMA